MKKAFHRGIIPTISFATHTAIYAVLFGEGGQLRKSELKGSWYCKPGLDGKIISLEESREAKTKFVTGVKSPSSIRSQVHFSIKNCLAMNIASLKVGFFAHGFSGSQDSASKSEFKLSGSMNFLLQ